ncbi:hypothetical protein M1D51_12805 [Arthrobacter sp. R3-55]
MSSIESIKGHGVTGAHLLNELFIAYIRSRQVHTSTTVPPNTRSWIRPHGAAY